VRLQASLDAERNSYLPLAKSGSSLYFTIMDLAKINNMYRYSLAAFLRLFEHALSTKHVMIIMIIMMIVITTCTATHWLLSYVFLSTLSPQNI
jgi:hypothetical protein